MNKMEFIDPFTDSIIQRITPDIRGSFSSIQLSAIKEAIASHRPGNKHLIDIRGIIPLFFTRYYFVFLMGRDKRFVTCEVEGERRQKSAIFAGIIALMFVILPVLALVIFLIYILKSFLGIDIFPDKHIWNLFE